MNDSEVLNRRFSNGLQIRFSQLADGIVVVEIDTPLATATISLHGGHIVSWHPKHQVKSVLWVSRSAKFIPGKAIRGGVPICWPWFGAHLTDAKLPSHGYARISPWEGSSVNLLDGGAMEINLCLPDNDSSRAQGPDGVRLSIQITVGETLKMALTTSNQSDREIVLTEGLHTYFQISDIAKISVLGLEGSEYIDLADENKSKQEAGPIVFEGELGRIYENNKATCVIDDVPLNRRIIIEKSGSDSTAVWNPWAAKAATMDDMGRDGWREMVCVESANALGNVVTVKAHESHTLAVNYSVQSL
jgi:D-hexose-6-phosphate mutarotase